MRSYLLKFSLYPLFQSFHSYFSSEHSRLLVLWRQVVGFRRHVCELKSATERLSSALRKLRVVCILERAHIHILFLISLESQGLVGHA